MPKKPSVFICSHNAPLKIAYCLNNQTNEVKEIQIENTDKFIMHSPDDWGLVLKYIKEIERRARDKNIKKEINKYIKTSEKLRARNSS